MDERLRRQERAAAGGDVEAGAGLLKERIRAGELSEGRVVFAAYLGDERARMALGGQTEQSEGDTVDLLKEMFHEINRNEKFTMEVRSMAIVRAAIVVARQVLYIFEAAMPDDQRPRQAIEAAERWVLGLPANRGFSLSGECRAVSHVPYDVYDVAGRAASHAASAAYYAVHSALGGHNATRQRLPNANAATRDAADAALVAARVAEPAELHRAIQEELVPWVLDEGDPVRERVEARIKDK